MFVCACVFFLLWWTLQDTEYIGYGLIPDRFAKPFAYFTGLRQHWGMFTKPNKWDGWYVIDAYTVGGKHYDLFFKGDGYADSELRAPSNTKPELIINEIPNRRWGKYMEKMRGSKYKRYKTYFGRYITRLWNRAHKKTKEKLDKFEIVLMKYDVVPDGQSRKIERQVLWKHDALSTAKKGLDT